MNNKELENATLNDTALENVSGGVSISKNRCGVDDEAVRRPKEELEESMQKKMLKKREK